jgi:tetratricopeptide (TPR) repeat protein
MTKVTLNKSLALFLAAAVCALAILPLRTLLAEYQSGRVAVLLDDPTTEGRDVLDLSAETLPVYEQALEALRSVAKLDPGKSRHHQALAELRHKLGTWSEAVEAMGGAQLRSSRADLEQALTSMREAIRLEPANPDLHLALGTYYDMMGREPSASDAEYRRAIGLFPHNSPLRYSVAMRYLLTGRREQAWEQAQVLAKIDDSYELPDTARGGFSRDLRTSWYMAMLAQSYLYRSYEIAWRSGPHSTDTIDAMTPKNVDADAGRGLFLEMQGE